jgi:hypothetical protein
MEAPKVERRLYTIRAGSAADLAQALGLHFQGAPGFLAVPAVGSNTLLLSGPRAVLEDALLVLREIDRPARTVHVEVLLLELKDKGAGQGGGDARDQELSGPSRDVLAKVRDLQRRGVISGVKTIRLTGLEGRTARTQVSEGKPYVTGTTTGRFGGAGVAGGGGGGPGGGPGGFGGPAVSRSITYRNVGTQIQVKPDIGADGLVGLELRIEDSRMRPEEGGVALGTDDRGAPIAATQFVTATVESSLQLRPGYAVVAQTSAQAGQAQTLILVSVSIEAPRLRDNK